MIKELIKLANHLDAKGLTKEADELDGVLKSILKMIEDKSIDIKEVDEGDQFEFDLFIDNKGEVVGAEPASGDLGSTCVMNEPAPDDEGVVAEYVVTDVDEGESEDTDQVEFEGHNTQNFDLCPGAVKAFKKIQGMDLDSGQKEIALEAIRDTDDLLAVEKAVLDSESASKDQIIEAIRLARSVAHNVGALSEDLDQDLSSDFEFLDMHIEKIADYL
jgi:hypothetical protein|tara:strand:- start:2332 stop:2982 length:651 start_codon:yes stop_codon:yes gene_type:complete